MEAASVLLGAGLMMGISNHTVKADSSFETEAKTASMVDTNNVENSVADNVDTQETTLEVTDDSISKDTAMDTEEDIQTPISEAKTEEAKDPNDSDEQLPDTENPDTSVDTPDKKEESNKLGIDVSGAQIKVEIPESAKDKVELESERNELNEYLIKSDKVDGDFLKVIYTGLNSTNKYGEIPIDKIEITFSDYEGKGFDTNRFSVYKLDYFGEFLTNAQNVTMSLVFYGADGEPIVFNKNTSCIEITNDRDAYDKVDSTLISEGSIAGKNLFNVSGSNIQIKFTNNDNNHSIYKWIVTPEKFEFDEVKPEEPDNGIKPPEVPSEPEKPGDTNEPEKPVEPETPDDTEGPSTPDNKPTQPENPSTSVLPDQSVSDSVSENTPADTVQNDNTTVVESPVEETENDTNEPTEEAIDDEQAVPPHAQSKDVESKKSSNKLTAVNNKVMNEIANSKDATTIETEEKQTQVNADQTEQAVLPETGEKKNGFAIILSMLVAGLGIIGLVGTRKKKHDK